MTRSLGPHVKAPSQPPATHTHSLHLLHAHRTLSGESPSEGLGVQLPVEETGRERAVPGKGHTATVRQVCPL